MNPFPQPTPGKETIIAEEILRALELNWNQSDLFVTHLYELAKRIDSINSITNGITKLVSLVAGIERSTSSETGNPKKVLSVPILLLPVNLCLPVMPMIVLTNTVLVMKS